MNDKMVNIDNYNNNNDKSTDLTSPQRPIDRQSSVMRDSVFTNIINPSVSQIKERRHVFHWLPVYFNNDIVHGCWWYVIGSILTTIIPCFPLISIYEGLWPEQSHLPDVDHTAAYGLLIFSGVFFTIGSYGLVRAFEEPPLKPLFSWYHFQTDELFAMWMFLLGIAPSIPIMSIYVYHEPENGAFKLALLICIIATICTFLFILVVYPSDKNRRELISPCIRCCTRGKSCLYTHLQNDWLISLRLFYYACVFGDIMSLGLLLFSIKENNGFDIYSYGTALVDGVLFTIGTMYFLAGSYPIKSTIQSSTENNIIEFAAAHL